MKFKYTWRLEDLVKYSSEVQTQIDGVYVPARPWQWGGAYGMLLRIRAAWEILTGRAEAFTWPKGQ